MSDWAQHREGHQGKQRKKKTAEEWSIGSSKSYKQVEENVESQNEINGKVEVANTSLLDSSEVASDSSKAYQEAPLQRNAGDGILDKRRNFQKGDTETNRGSYEGIAK
ncbi:hypothetical protein NECAME_04375 [Necator americanus]|uniref:Uncharacterized protein n=1 Tax=Necator americanus TaxID=51031 RepID=W2SWJ0_NECAM|nr:hypothetical protein NECAME_04375 [Necator americanus]ETN73067.1 hypothetical protein NECAME_04375 [Necator americanus]